MENNQVFEAAKTAFGQPFATAHIITGGVIEKSYVAFEKKMDKYTTYVEEQEMNLDKQVCQYMMQM